MKTCNLIMLGVAIAGTAFPALGQQLINLGMGSDDMTADGQTVIGSLYEADINKYILYTWSQAAGATRLGIEAGQGATRISSDASVVVHAGYNIENLGGFSNATITRRWTQATGSVNLGLIPGGSSCDSTINQPGDMSRNGQFIAGSGWFSGQCGAMRAWVYDNNTHVFTRLPGSVSPPPAYTPSSASVAWGVSDDGNTVIGYDQNYSSAGLGQQRLATVWTKSGTTWTITHLDPNGGSLGCVSGDGNVIFGKMSSYTMNQVFGTTNASVIRWVRTGATWTPTNLGGSGGFSPLDTNVDGSKMLGEACYWSADVNGGVPMDLTAYLGSRGVGMGGLTIYNPMGNAVHSMSDDGTKITFNAQDAHGACLTVFPMMLADLTSPDCLPPRVTFSPVSQVITSPTHASNPYGIILNVFASGSWPLNYQWQKEISPGTWTNLADDSCPSADSSTFDVRGADNFQLRLGFMGVYNTWQGNYRCLITNECGSATSGTAVIAPPPTCGSADFNCDGDVATDADIESFFACVAGTCPAAPCNSTADFNGDGDAGTDADIEAFFRVLAGGTC
jgi:hypothetical protein